jgi:glycine/D-amino acid oxidase-like deaminating enzyme
VTTTIESVGDARRHSVWFERAPAIPEVELHPSDQAGLLVVGGGLTGLWAAVEAAGGGRDVLVVDRGPIGGGASGRCGGFINASITHGIAHGHARWPDEMPAIVALQQALWDDTLDLLAKHDASGVIEPTGKLNVATRPHQLADVDAAVALLRRYDQTVERLDAAEIRAAVCSPTYLGGYHHADANGLCDPVALVGALASIAVGRGARLVSGVDVVGFDEDGDGVIARLGDGRRIRAGQVLLATNAARPLRRTIARRMIPVYDHVVATAPLPPERWEAIGWHRHVGVTDMGNRFHYYRPTPDGRILFGGWDATYHFGSRVDPALEWRPETHTLLARHLLETLPALDGVEITHAWGGAIDSTSRFTPMIGIGMDGKLGWAVGFTGLGVGASRFAALAALDRLSGQETERTCLSMMRRAPIPFPPEPLRSLVVAVTKWSMVRADESGRRNVWLRLLDRFGVGFDT